MISRKVDDSLALDRQLCLDLSAAARAVVSLYRPLLEPHGLTHPQYLVLVALWEHGELSVKRLGDVLHLDSGTLSPLVKRLEVNQLVTRSRTAADERRVMVALTPAGAALRDTAAGVHDGVVKALGLSDEDLAQLHETLTRIVAAARANDDPAGGPVRNA